MQPDRLTQIRHYLYAHGETRIHELARSLDISLATLRRDLQRLEEQGIVTRSHGGAAIAEFAGLELGFSVRENRNLAEKRAIAVEAYRRLRPRSVVFFDAGTTVLQLAKLLRLRPTPLTLFTNSLAVAEVLFGVEPVQVFMLGGRLRHENKCVVGPIAEQVIDQLWFDQLYLGASAVQPDQNVATPDGDESRLNSSMLRRSAEHLLLADSSKFGRNATYRVAPLKEMTELISDDGLDEGWRARLTQTGLRFVLAHLEGTERPAA